jgi:Dolichyl-phosphate-mannose-protein mannosyltransferase
MPANTASGARVPARRWSLARASPDILLLLGVVAAEAAFAAVYALRATHWAVMTDELQNVKLATNVARTGSPLPVLHGRAYGAWSMLYPLALAPLYASLPATAAARGAHLLNAVAMVSTAVPVYLLTRSVTRSRAAAWAGAALTGLVPWVALSTAVLTENVAYPAFAWAVLLIHRALGFPGDRRAFAALAALALAVLARTQFLLLAVVLPVALIAHEAGFAAARARPGARSAAAARALREAARSQRVLVGASVLGAAAAVALAATGRLAGVLGSYASTLSGGLLPPGVWRASADHLDRVVVGIGIVPFVLAVAWSFLTIASPARKEAHAFCVLLLLVVPLLSLQAASFDLRFTPGAFPQERYVFYIAPLLFVGMVACLVDRGRRGVRAALVLAAGILFVALALLGSFEPTTAIFWASPASAFHSVIGTAAGSLGLSADSLVVLAAAAIVLAAAGAVLRVEPLRTLAVVTVAVAVFCVFETRHVLEADALPAVTRPSMPSGAPRDWIDSALPGAASVALVPQPYWGPEPWWDAEFWNKTVDRAVSVDRGPTYTPFPADALHSDFARGSLSGSSPTRLLVLAIDDPRFQLAQARVIAAAPPLELVRTTKRLRADWLTRGLYADGWTHPGQTARFRFYAPQRARRWNVVIALSAAPNAVRPQRYRLVPGAAAATTYVGSLAPGAHTRVAFDVAVPANGFRELRLAVRGRARLADGRVVGLHVDRVQVGAPAR